MESIYAALLLHKVGSKITDTKVEKVLNAAGAKVDKDQISKLIAGLKDTDITEIIKTANAAPIIAAPTGGSVEKKKEKKKEKEEVEEEPTGIYLKTLGISSIGSLF